MKKFVLLTAAIAAFLTGYGVIAMAYPSPPPYGRAAYHGFFTNAPDPNFSGDFVLPNIYSGQAFPASVNNAGAFINFIKSNLGGTPQQRTGASFIIQTMNGPYSTAVSRNRPPTAAEIAKWESAVNTYAAQGRINFFFNYTHTLNTYFEGSRGFGTPNDDAFFDGAGTSTAIVFFNPDGSTYAIRRQCANPIGVASLQATPNYSISGRTTVSNASPKPGQPVTFSHFVKNNGPDGAAAVWWAAVNTLTGIQTAAGGPNAYGPGAEVNVNNETFTVPAGTPPNTQYCRRVDFAPASNAGGGGSGPTVCATVPYDFGLTPDVTIVINGGATPGSFAEVGDKIDFIYSVNNTGTTVSMTTSCTINGKSYTGYVTVPAPPDSTSDPGYAPPATGCPRVFPINTNTTLATETIASVPAGSANRTLCRSLSVNPSSPTTGAKAVEACVSIANKPYLRVYGGDVSAGNGLATSPGTCVNNTQAAVVSWNTEGPLYSGAGAQFAVLALNQIYDFATTLGNTGGAPPPSSLAFANQTVSGGNFGGSLGSVPCIDDYYATKPAATSPFVPPNLTPLGNGSYSATGPITAKGNINPGDRIVLYVQGDVLITNDITFSGSWNAGNVPFFELIAKGNIYISQDVTQLDGIYVAQRNGATGGTIYTCANPGLPVAAVLPSGGSVFSNCKNQLIVNGAFVAHQVQFLRANGTLRQSSPSEKGDTTGHGAEVFNYNPTLWMAIPPGAATTNDYDSIASLPPIL